MDNEEDKNNVIAPKGEDNNPTDKELNFRKLEASFKAVKDELASLKAEKEVEATKALEEQNKYKELYEELKGKVDEKEVLLKQMSAKNAIQQILSQEKIQPEFQDLLFDKINSEINGDVEKLSETISQIKEKYPSMFATKQDIINIGTGATTSGTTAMSKQRAEEIFNSKDPSKYTDEELEQAEKTLNII